jgi:putative tryptophan/tyrosine transport system substrate-binding protein
MRRREFLAGLTLPLLSSATAGQTAGRVYRVACPLAIGNLTPETAKQDTILYGPIIEELRKAGFVQGGNLRFEFSTVDGHFDRMGKMAVAVVHSNPDVIFSASTELAHHCKGATSSIPVVAHMNEAVVDGFARSFARPERNFTGISWSAEYSYLGKWFELLRELLPKASRVAILYTDNGRSGGWYIDRFARLQGFVLVDASLHSPVTAGEFRRFFEGLGERNVDAVVMGGQPETFANVDLIIRLAQEFRTPVMYDGPGPARLGGLIELSAYTSWSEVARITADYLSRILKGARPADMPIYHTDRTKVRVNLNTAKALGLEIPPAILARADEVIE